MTECWDDWIMTCGEPSVWCGFDWPVMPKSYVVYPQPRCPVCACMRDYRRALYPCTHPGCPEVRAERLKAGIREYACTATDHPCGCYDQFLSERAEIERLRALSQNNAQSWVAIVRERDELRAEVERLTALKTPASRELLNITKGCLDDAEAEVERLTELRAKVERLRALLRRHQVCAWCEVDSDLAEETHAALEPKP